MKICIVGAGAVGSHLAVCLARSGFPVSVVARGAHLQAIRTQGLKLIRQGDPSQTWVEHLTATDDPAALGPQDWLIVTVKAHSLPQLAPRLGSLCGPDTPIVIAQNGIPWWYFYRHGGEFEGHSLTSVDPEGVIAAHLPIERVIGCVVYIAVQLAEPGVVLHTGGGRYILGEPDGSLSERLQSLAAIFEQAQLSTTLTSQIRAEIWQKLWGNAAFNPISALTRAAQDEIAQYPPTHALVRSVMQEVEAVAQALGIRLPVSLEERLEDAARVGSHRTSMLQDIELGRRTEIEAIVGAITELGRLVGVPTPRLDTLYACVKLLERSL
ncbi:MAG TPA: 2-dehydropantoate 2-reductase [Synechococcus sp. M44_DOE_062]|nr:2-dehydropantoate 2-reductase [Synechococcus sp. M44_DOE_062]